MSVGAVVLLSDSDDDITATAASQLKREVAASTDNEMVDRQKGRVLILSSSDLIHAAGIQPFS